MNNMIYHIPWKIKEGRLSATGIRPLEMLKAFRDLGWNVEAVIGSSNERKNAVRRIKKSIKEGCKYSFVYSESSVGPTLIANGWRETLKVGNLDLSFLKFCKKAGIPLGLYYRDMHWKFSLLRQDVPRFKEFIFHILHKMDLKFYNRFLDIMYLPSDRMKPLLPEGYYIKKALPPASDVKKLSALEKDDKSLTLFYVGGLGSLYQVQTLFKVVSAMPDVKLIFCTRKEAWMENRKNYDSFLNDNIEIIHKSGDELFPYMQRADLGVLFLKPHEYMSLAMPVKMFEYLSCELPLLATKGTAAGDWVKEQKAGWVIPYEEGALKELLTDLLTHPEKKDEIKKGLNEIQKKNRWTSRALQAAEDLMNCGKERSWKN